MMIKRVAVGTLLALFLIPAAAGAHSGQINRQGRVVKVMTRNVYLGADLSPAIGAPTLPALIAGDGAILRQVDATNFPVRAKGLAAEILSQKPDLVGLQEVAEWRTGPVSFAPLQGFAPTASNVRYDYLKLLLDQLNAKRETYRAVVVEPEFDFEAPADEDGTGGPSPLYGADLNARLTMRDVILERVDDASLKVADPKGGHFTQLLTLPLLTGSVTVIRGWAAIDARVRGKGWFRFVDTHLESFDSGPPFFGDIRAAQAAELIAQGGPATGSLPVVLVGDLNSDATTVAPNDQKAYRVLLAGGFSERSTSNPLSCCIEGSYDLTTGTASEFNHKVDHIMTNDPEVALLDSGVTGLTMNNGWWDSDHAGLWSSLVMP